MRAGAINVLANRICRINSVLSVNQLPPLTESTSWGASYQNIFIYPTFQKGVKSPMDLRVHPLPANLSISLHKAHDLFVNNLRAFYVKAKAIGLGNALIRAMGRTLHLGSRTAGLPNEADALSTHQDYSLYDGVIPLPNARLMDSTGSPTVENFLVVGDAWSQVVSSFATRPVVVLDIACGCGKTARFLARHPHISRYVGFDTIRPSIVWNQKYITSRVGEHFDFHHIDVYSEAYNPSGKIKCSDVKFPVADASVDLAFAASLFTHLLEDDCKHYLEETVRSLAPKGKALLSIHAASFGNKSYSGDEFRADIDDKHFIQLATNAGLTFIKRLNDLCGQQLYIFEK